MSTQQPEARLSRSEIMAALVSLGEDPCARDIEQLRDRIDASTLAAGDREAAVLAAIGTVRQQFAAAAAVWELRGRRSEKHRRLAEAIFANHDFGAQVGPSAPWQTSPPDWHPETWTKKVSVTEAGSKRAVVVEFILYFNTEGRITDYFAAGDCRLWGTSYSIHPDPARPKPAREYLFRIEGLGHEAWQAASSEQAARNAVWWSLTDEERDRAGQVACIDERAHVPRRRQVAVPTSARSVLFGEGDRATLLVDRIDRHPDGSIRDARVINGEWMLSDYAGKNVDWSRAREVAVPDDMTGSTSELLAWADAQKPDAGKVPQTQLEHVAMVVRAVREEFVAGGRAASFEQINWGKCREFADEVIARLKARGIDAEEGDPDDALRESDVHAWIRVGDRVFDSEAPEGVADFRDLPFFKRRLVAPGVPASPQEVSLPRVLKVSYVDAMATSIAKTLYGDGFLARVEEIRSIKQGIISGLETMSRLEIERAARALPATKGGEPSRESPSLDM